MKASTSVNNAPFLLSGRSGIWEAQFPAWPHRQHPGASPTKSRLHSPLLALVLAVVLTISGCAPARSYQDDLRGWSIPAGDDTPLRQRQSLEDYATTVVPAILEFEEQITHAGSGSWRSNQTLSFQFDIVPCLDESTGPDSGTFELSTIGTGAVPLETVQHIGEELFVPLGFQAETTQDAHGNHEVTWTDWSNGGQLKTFIGERVITLSGFSECRPTSDRDRVRAELHALDPLRTSPAHPPSSPDPSPGHTRNLPRAAQRCTARPSEEERMKRVRTLSGMPADLLFAAALLSGCNE